MAQNDDELIEEVRSLTGYSEQIIDPAEMHSLLLVAKEDIRGLSTGEIPDIYDDKVAERATFWTVVMFTKVFTGELDAPNFKIGSISVDTMPRRDIVRVWYRQLDQYVNRLSSGRALGIGSPRRTSREYSDEYSREQFQ